MKKIFTLLFAAALTLSVSAITPVQRTNAPVQVTRQLNVKNQALNQGQFDMFRMFDNKAQIKRVHNAAASNEVGIVAENITATTADIAAQAEEDTTVFYWNILKAVYYDSLANGLITKYPSVQAYSKAYMDYMISYYAYYGYDYGYADFASVGFDSYSLTGLTSNTEYVAYALKLDTTTGACDTVFASVRFTTDTVAQSTNVITMTYDATNKKINITTTNSDPYFFIFESQDDYDSYESDLTQASLKDEAESWISTADYYSMTSYLTFTGKQSIDVNSFYTSYLSEDDLETGDYIALAAPYNEEVNGTVAYLQFHYDEPQVVVTDTVTLHFIQPEWTDYVSGYGWWQVMAATDVDTTYFISMSNGNDITQFAGTYTQDDMDGDYTYIYVDADQTSYKFQTLTVEITEDANNNITITAEGDAKNGVHYIITFDNINPVTSLNDVATEQKAQKVIENGKLYIYKEGHKFNAQGQMIK